MKKAYTITVYIKYFLNYKGIKTAEITNKTNDHWT